jgi:serine/threonine protein kinase
MSLVREDRTFFVFETSTKVTKEYRNLGTFSNKGGIGIPFLALDVKTQQKIVIKKIVQSKTEIQYLIEAVVKAKSFNHKSLAKYYDYFVDNNTSTTTLYITMPYYKHEDLGTFLAKHQLPLTHEQVSSIMEQLTDAIHYLHSCQKSLHRDISIGNIFVEDFEPNGIITVVLGDFDIIRECEQTTFLTGQIGKIDYMSPEVLLVNTERLAKYGFATDIWSLGVVLVEIMLQTPARDLRLGSRITSEHEGYLVHFELKEKIRNTGRYEKELVNTVLAMLRYNPNERPSYHSIEYPVVAKRSRFYYVYQHLYHYRAFYTSLLIAIPIGLNILEKKKVPVVTPTKLRFQTIPNLKQVLQERSTLRNLNTH